MPESSPIQSLAVLAQNARQRILSLSHAAKSAHAGSSLSCVEMLASCFHKKFREPGSVDKVILSKGHAAMALYAVAEQFGLLSGEDLSSYLSDGSRLWGHPSKASASEWIDWSTGSLGHGLPAAVGMAYARAKLQPEASASRTRHAVAVVVSDGECDEGSNWEAALFAGHHRLSNLIVFIDYNKIQSLDRVENVLNLEPLAAKWRAFNWHCVEIDGHSTAELEAVWQISQEPSKPLCVICHTVKGKGVPDIEDTVASHYKPITEAQLKRFHDAK